MVERGPIQLVPPGLLGLLQLKADGRSVSNLTDTCVPSLEMLPWWLRSTALLWNLVSTGNQPAGTVQGFAGFTVNSIGVPANQWWYVHEYSVRFNLAAANGATWLRLAWAATFAGTIYYAPLADPLDTACVNLAGPATPNLTARDFWLPPGARLGFYVAVVTGGTGLDSNLSQLRYSVLPS